MSHEFKCPQCHEMITSSAESVSAESVSSAVCPHCGASIAIPIAQAVPAMTPTTEISYASAGYGSPNNAWKIVGVLAIFCVPLLLLMIVLPSFHRRGLSTLTICAANLKGIGMGLYTYANENDEMFPIAHHRLAEAAGVGKVDYTRAIGAYRGTESDPDAGNTDLMDPPPDRLSTVRNFWTLVREGASAPGSFICPDSDDQKSDVDDPEPFWDFGFGDIDRDVSAAEAKKAYSQVSYGYQVPYGKVGQPRPDLDQRMAIAADQGPFGDAIERGKSAPSPITANATSTPDDWMEWNSPNHEGEGQNVLYADCHAEFQVKPTVGVSQDNIYTRWNSAESDLTGRVQGTPPTLGGKETPMHYEDSLIYP